MLIPTPFLETATGQTKYTENMQGATAVPPNKVASI